MASSLPRSNRTPAREVALAAKHESRPRGGTCAMDSVELMQVFQTAIRKENEAAQFYREWASRTNDTRLQKLLRQFAGEEEAHQAKLNELYISLRDQSPPGT